MKYAKYAAKGMENENQKSFQQFIFSVRYWKKEIQFGLEGGKSYLDEVLEIEENDSLQRLKETIKSSFEKLECYLMPKPGVTVATSTTFDGSWAHIDRKYFDIMKSMIPSFLAPHNLMIKKFNGRELRGHELFKSITSFATSFSKSKHLPIPKIVYEGTIETNIYLLVEKVVVNYENNLIKQGPSAKSDEDFYNLYLTSKKEALKIFFESRNFVDKKQAEGFDYQLKWQFDDIYEKYCDSKRKSCKSLKKDEL